MSPNTPIAMAALAAASMSSYPFHNGSPSICPSTCNFDTLSQRQKRRNARRGHAPGGGRTRNRSKYDPHFGEKQKTRAMFAGI